MLTIVCGEDLINCRNFFSKLKFDYKNKKYEIIDLQFNELLDLHKWQASNLSLFAEKKVFFCENINRKINRRSPQQIKLLENLIKDKSLIIIDWEQGISARELKLSKLATIKEFKPAETIFKLVDSCYPGNLRIFVNLLNSLSDRVEDGFVFFMLIKHIRNLLLIKSKEKPKKMLDWQIWKLQKQAKFWSIEKLIAFYDGLHRIDIITKTSKNPFSILHSLDILAYYIL